MGAFHRTPGQIIYDQGQQRSRAVWEPVLYGGGLVGTYDRPATRWVPVDLSAISPHGLSYAYGYQPPGQSNSSQIRLVDVRSGKERVVFTGPSPNGYDVVGYRGDGIYFTRALRARTDAGASIPGRAMPLR